MIKLERIYLEIGNICNLACPFCLPRSRPPQTMTVDRIIRILPQIKKIASSVCLHVLGEPLFHPEFDAICDLLTVWEVPVQITTNGTLLYKKRKEILKQNTIRQINISLQALDFPHVSHDCHKLLSGIHQFCCKAMIARPELYINLRFWNFDKIEHSPTFQFFQSLFNFDVSKIDIQWKKSFHLQGRLYLNFDSQFQWPSLTHSFRSEKGYCYGLTHHCGILANGDVIPCCLDGNGEIVLGNCLVTPLEEILSLPRAQNMTAHFNKGELIEPLCRHCGFISRFDKKARRLATRHKSCCDQTIKGLHA
jgi:MoaA/NifB/PqqE/SkfB family radical SAM enzyme